MRRGLAQSFTLHTLILLVVIFGLPHLGRDEVMMASPIAVEVVSADQVASAPQKAHAPPPSPPKTPTPAPPKPAPTPPPEPVAPQPPPPPDEAAPAPPEKQVKPPDPPKVPPPPAPPKPVPPRKVDKPPQPPAKADPPPKTPARPNDSFANLINTLSKDDDGKPPRDGAADSPVEDSPNISTLLNGSELDAVRQQVMGCWLEPTGLKEGEQYVVEIKVEINEDRTVRSAKVVDSPKMRADPFYRTLGESAVRALYNPRCSPLLLPEGKYGTWKRITFRFSPGGVM